MSQRISPSRVSLVGVIVALCVVAASCGSQQSDTAADVASQTQPAASTSSDDGAEQAPVVPPVQDPSESEGLEPDLDDEIVDGPASCIAFSLEVSELWIEQPEFGEVRDLGPDLGGEVDVVSARSDQRAPSVVDGPIVSMGVRAVLADAVAATPTSDGPDVGFFVAHVDGFSMGGLIDIDKDRIWVWTDCDGNWNDVTGIMTDWAGTDDPGAVLEQLTSLVLTPRWTEEGSKIREEEIARIALIEMGAPEPSTAWADREPHSRTWLDDDLPQELGERLSSMLIRIDGVERVDDPDLVVCPVQPTAGVGYCFGIAALADAGPDAAIEISVHLDEPVVLMLGRESLWDKPGHELVLGEIAGTSEAADLHISGQTPLDDPSLDAVLDGLQVRFEAIPRADIKNIGVYLGGARP